MYNNNRTKDKNEKLEKYCYKALEINIKQYNSI